MSAPGKELLDAYRRQRANLQPFGTLYPYAMGRVEGALTDGTVKPAERVKLALLNIAALDAVMREPEPRRLARCLVCGAGEPGHMAGCSLAPVATPGPRS